MLLATIDSSIVIIAMPDIFRGIGLDPLEPGNSFYLLWMILGYLVTSSVLVVSVGRLGDMFGRVRMYNLGFVIYTVAVAAADRRLDDRHRRDSGCWSGGSSRASAARSSSATPAPSSPTRSRPSSAAWRWASTTSPASAASFIGLVVGGILAPISWRLVFLVSVPFGIFGTVWAVPRLRDLSARSARARSTGLGNITFAAGLILIMIGITRGIQPYDGHAMGWTSPPVIGLRRRRRRPARRCSRSSRPGSRTRCSGSACSRSGPSPSGPSSTFLSALGRGGLMFMLIIWLQGIWLPLHGYSFERTPLWAGIYMLPLTVGMLTAGPHLRLPVRPVRVAALRHRRDDRRGRQLRAARAAADRLPYPLFALILLLNGLSMGCFASPNRAGRDEQPARPGTAARAAG